MGKADYLLKCKKTEAGVVVTTDRPFWGSLLDVKPKVLSTINQIRRIGGAWEFVLHNSNDEIVSIESLEPVEFR